MTAPTLAPAVCTSYIGARRLRVTRLDRCGRPVNHERGYVVSSGFVQVEITPQVSEGDDYSQKNAAGDLVVSDTGPDALQWFDVSIQFCQVDPDVFTMLNPTWKLVTNAQGQATGFRIGQKFSDQDGFALELWPKVSGGGVGCEDDAPEQDPNFPLDPNGYFLLPWVLGRAPDSWTLENATATFTIQGRTKVGSRWGRGPWAVTRDEHGQPGPLLVPIEDGLGSSGVPSLDGTYDPDLFHADQVTIAPPPARCGAQPLRLPAFTATATDLQVDVTISNYAEISDPNGDDVVRVFWGDGTPYETVTDPGTATHTYASEGTYTVTVMAARSRAVRTQQVTVTAPAGAAVASTFAAPATTATEPEQGTEAEAGTASRKRKK